MAGFAATVGGIAVTIMREEATIGDLPFAQAIAKGSRSGVPRVTSVSMNEPRTLSCKVLVTGATKDALIANIAAINAKIRVGCDIVVQSTNATNAVTLKVLPSRPSAPGLDDPSFELGLSVKLPLAVIIEPYAYGPETTLVNAVATTYPGVVDLTVPGDLPAPLQLTFAGAGLHCLYAGLLPDQALALPLAQCEAQTWTGGTCAASAGAERHGGSAEQNTAVSAAGASVADTAFPAGTYKMLGRLTTTGAATFAIDGAGSVTLAANAWRLDEFGTLHLPYLAVRAAMGSAYIIRMTPASGGAYFDYSGAVPQSWGWMQWHPASGAAVTANLVHEYDGRIYNADVADAVNGRSGGLLAVGAQRLVVFADTAHGSGAAGGTISLTTTVKVVPRYVLWR